MRLRTAILVGLAALVVAATASARATSDDTFNARYCEVFLLHGLPPTAKVVVYNTIGLDDCPAAKWEALEAQESSDPSSLAAELGATAVILNGPRHFIMDSASGRIGAKRVIGGIRTRRVATIPITSPADLSRTPYTERTIDRHNIWRWDKGRRVYELVAPGGVRYVMQSYSQIVDPTLSLSDLPTLTSRLSPPAGWHYKVLTLRHDLVLRARGTATIIQDDLQDTYQRLPSRSSR